MISEIQREMNAQCTQLQLNFKREHEENVKEKEKMRDSIERLTRIKDDLMKSLTLMTKERDSFREKAMGEKLLHFNLLIKLFLLLSPSKKKRETKETIFTIIILKLTTTTNLKKKRILLTTVVKTTRILKLVSRARFLAITSRVDDLSREARQSIERRKRWRFQN